MQETHKLSQQRDLIKQLSDNLYAHIEAAWRDLVLQVTDHAAQQGRMTGYGLSISSYARHSVFFLLDNFYRQVVSIVNNHLLAHVKNKYIYKYKNIYDIRDSIDETLWLEFQELHILFSSFHIDRAHQKARGEVNAICCTAAMESLKTGGKPVFPELISYFSHPRRLSDLALFCRLEASAVCNHAAVLLNERSGLDSVIGSVSGEHHNEGLLADPETGLFESTDHGRSPLWVDGRGYFPPSDFSCREIVYPGRKQL